VLRDEHPQLAWCRGLGSADQRAASGASLGKRLVDRVLDRVVSTVDG